MASKKNLTPERKAFIDKPFKEKFAFYWKYMKGQIIFWALAAIFFIYFIVKSVTAPVLLLNGIMLNTGNDSEDTSVETLIENYIEFEKIDTSSGSIQIDDSLAYVPGDTSEDSGNYDSSMAILTQKQEKQLDFVAGNLTAMENLAYNTLFADLTTILSKEETALYEPYFLYIDQTVIAQLEEAFDNKEDLSTIPLPDCRKPDDMKDPVPVLIDISKSDKLLEVYGSATETLAFGIINESPEQDSTLQFLAYLMNVRGE